MPKRSNESGARPSAVVKRRQGGKGKPFAKGNPYRVKAGTILNPTGKTRKLSEAYVDWLKSVDENGEHNANKVAKVVGAQSLDGNANAYKELRQATEGDKQYNYDLSQASDEQLHRIANGEEATHVLATESASVAPVAGAAGEEGSLPDPTPPTLDSV